MFRQAALGSRPCRQAPHGFQQDIPCGAVRPFLSMESSCRHLSAALAAVCGAGRSLNGGRLGGFTLFLLRRAEGIGLFLIGEGCAAGELLQQNFPLSLVFRADEA